MGVNAATIPGSETKESKAARALEMIAGALEGEFDHVVLWRLFDGKTTYKLIDSVDVATGTVSYRDPASDHRSAPFHSLVGLPAQTAFGDPSEWILFAFKKKADGPVPPSLPA